jgi:hypothetical protein
MPEYSYFIRACEGDPSVGKDLTFLLPERFHGPGPSADL